MDPLHMPLYIMIAYLGQLPPDARHAFNNKKMYPMIIKLRRRFGTKYAMESLVWSGEGFCPTDDFGRKEALLILKKKAAEYEARFDDAVAHQLKELESEAEEN